MDPASIVAIVQGASSLALKCVGLAKTLNDVASKYKQSRLAVLSIVQHLEVVQLAWERIDKWSRIYLQDGTQADCDEDDRLFKRLQTSLDVGYLVMEALEGDLLPFQHQLDNLGLRGKTRIVWSESVLNAHQDRLGHQVRAMTCLLQTIQLELPTTRRDLLRLSEPILLKSDESAYSIVPSRMSSRISLSTTQSIGSNGLEYRHLAFEDALFTTRVYKRNYRTAMIEQLFKVRTDWSKRKATSEDGRIATNNSEASPNLARSPESMSSFPSTTLDLFFADACRRNAADTLKELMSSGQQVHTRKVSFDVFRWSVAEAVMNNRLPIARTLLNFGSETDIQQLMEYDGLFLIGRACVKRNRILLKLLLEPVPKCSYPVARIGLNVYLLQVSSTNSYEMMKLLLDAGADVNCADKEGSGPLHLVSSHTGLFLIDMLLSYGADIDTRNNKGMTPLIYACSQRNIYCAEALIGFGANVHLRDNTGEKAIDKLHKIYRGLSKDRSLLSTLARGLRDVIEALRDAGIDALDHENVLLRNIRPASVALYLRWHDPISQSTAFFSALDTFVMESLQALRSPNVMIKAPNLDFILAIISTARKLYRNVLDRGHADSNLHDKLLQSLHSVLDFLFWIIYRSTFSLPQQTHIDILRSLCRPVLDAMDELNLTSHSSIEALTEFHVGLCRIEEAIPAELKRDHQSYLNPYTSESCSSMPTESLTKYQRQHQRGAAAWPSYWEVSNEDFILEPKDRSKCNVPLSAETVMAQLCAELLPLK